MDLQLCTLLHVFIISVQGIYDTVVVGIVSEIKIIYEIGLYRRHTRSIS
jgi:hypothetical protein